MKTVLIVIIGILLWQSTDARKFTANVLQTASDMIEPDNTREQTIGERIDNFLNWTMRITLLGFFTIFAANVFVNIMDSQMVSTTQERNQIVERYIQND